MKLLIIGGVAGGATAAARARRLDEHAHIVLFERGEYISFANCGLPYYIGGIIPKRSDLIVTTPDALTKRYDIDIRIFSEITRIDRARKRSRSGTSGRERSTWKATTGSSSHPGQSLSSCPSPASTFRRYSASGPSRIPTASPPVFQGGGPNRPSSWVRDSSVWK